MLHKDCFQFRLGQAQYPREMKNKVKTKVWGTNKVHYGRCASGVCNQNVRIPNSPSRIITKCVATPSPDYPTLEERTKNCVFSLRCAWQHITQTTKSFRAGEFLAYISLLILPDLDNVNGHSPRLDICTCNVVWVVRLGHPVTWRHGYSQVWYTAPLVQPVHRSNNYKKYK